MINTPTAFIWEVWIDLQPLGKKKGESLNSRLGILYLPLR